MSHVDPIRVGRFGVEVVCEGWAPLALADECPGRSVDWEGERERYPWAFAGDGAWPWHVHAFVIRTGTALVLIDTGVGAAGPYAPWERHESEAWAGLPRADVDHVILTHLHADHAGGSVVNGAPRFPNAAYHVHPADWAAFAEADDEEDYVSRHALEAVAVGGGLDLEPFDHEVVPGVMVRHTPGHTPGHRSVLVRDRGESLLVTGDLLHTPTSADHPSWPSSHDVDAHLACASRRLFLWHARAGGWLIGVSHFAEPFGRIEGERWLAE